MIPGEMQNSSRKLILIMRIDVFVHISYLLQGYGRIIMGLCVMQAARSHMQHTSVAQSYLLFVNLQVRYREVSFETFRWGVGLLGDG
jgi:hypothetical protein